MRTFSDGRGNKHFYEAAYQLDLGNAHQKQRLASPGYSQVPMRRGKTPDDWQQEVPQGWGRSDMSRAALANWITDPEYGVGHLAARVIVNRLWQRHFGEGLVRTPNDFGLRGDTPSNPELPDWLASTLIENKWSLNHIHRLILNSATYRQSDQIDKQRADIDLENRLHWRHTPRRLEAEAIRDSMLNIAGLLDKEMYGRGSLDESMRRRSVYFTTKRSKPIPTMMLFDWPEHLVSIGRRPVTTTAPQALMMLNNPQTREFATAFALRVAKRVSGGRKKSVEREFQNAIESGTSLSRRIKHMKRSPLAAIVLGVCSVVHAVEDAPPIQHVVIEPGTKDSPRSDTASIAQISESQIMVVYHKYESGERGGHDHGVCRIWSKVSDDWGKTWKNPRMLVDVADGDMNVQAPALLRTKNGNLLLVALRAHPGSFSSTMCIFKSVDGARTFLEFDPLWTRSKGQLLQGGTSSLLQLKSGRLLLPYHGGTGTQFRQKNSAWCLYSDDSGENWTRSNAIDLPKRGAIEGSVTQLDNGSLLMSLRTQLGGPHIARSSDEGKTWGDAVFSGLEGGESGTCLRRLPGSTNVVLFFNNSRFNKDHHHYGERTPLTCARSSDEGKSWRIIGNILADPDAEYTNLDCFFTPTGDAVVTYMYAKPAWNRDQIHLRAALIPRSWFDG